MFNTQELNITDRLYIVPLLPHELIFWAFQRDGESHPYGVTCFQGSEGWQNHLKGIGHILIEILVVYWQPMLIIAFFKFQIYFIY